MLTKAIYEQCLTTNGWVSLDPVDRGIVGRLSKKHIREEEEKLMLAVLAIAIEDFQRNVLARNEVERKLFQEAEEWILEKNSDWLFSFENICDALELNPDYIRRGLRSWKEATRKSRSIQARHPRRVKLVRHR